MERKFLVYFLIGFLALTLVSSIVMAQETEEDIELFGLELEKLIFLVNGWIALFLAVIAFAAFRRDGRKRLMFVSLAFVLFAIKSFMFASELIFPEIAYIDPIAAVLEFFVILSFFYGVVQK
jgi:hypothetical protein